MINYDDKDDGCDDDGNNDDGSDDDGENDDGNDDDGNCDEDGESDDDGENGNSEYVNGYLGGDETSTSTSKHSNIGFGAWSQSSAVSRHWLRIGVMALGEQSGSCASLDS